MPALKRLFRSLDDSVAIAAYAAIQMIFVAVMVSRCYSLHFLVLTDRDFIDCTKQSKKILSKKKFKTAVSIIFWSVAMFAAAAIITFIISFIIFLMIRDFQNRRKDFCPPLKYCSMRGGYFHQFRHLFPLLSLCSE